MVVGDEARPIRRIAWCSGGAQGYFEQAIALGVDAYLSGEISEQTVHLARESGVAYLAAGHHATERYGVQALAETIRGFKMIVNGECDHLPEQAFYMVGTIDEAFEKAKKI